MIRGGLGYPRACSPPLWRRRAPVAVSTVVGRDHYTADTLLGVFVGAWWPHDAIGFFRRTGVTWRIRLLISSTKTENAIAKYR